MKTTGLLERGMQLFGVVASLSVLALIIDFGVHLWSAYHGRVNTSSIFGG